MERLLAAEQKAIDYKPVDDGNAPDHRPTNACTKSVTSSSLGSPYFRALRLAWLPGYLDVVSLLSFSLVPSKF